MKEKHKNEMLKRQYTERMRLVGKRSNATVEAFERAIRRFELANDFADFGAFDRRQAQKFVRTISESGAGAKTQAQLVKQVRQFFGWLSGQPGYKTRVRLDDIEYLTVDRKTALEALEEKEPRFPSLDYVLKLSGSIGGKSEEDMRDRAIISLLTLTGIRLRAASTLSIGCFDTIKLEVRQYPSEGVATKSSKGIVAYMFRIDQKLIDNVLEWREYLVKVRLFANTDPLFPRTKVQREPESGLFEYSGVEPVFWQSEGPISAILRRRAEAAGLEVFNPHSFRHLTAHLVLPRANGPEQWQAIKQNFGHKFLATTMDCYGKLMPSRQAEVIASFDFSTLHSELSEPEDEARAFKLFKEFYSKLDRPKKGDIL